MYAEKVATVLTDLTIPQKITNRILRDHNMQIIKKFTPVDSFYKLSVGDNKRVTMQLTENEFVHKEESFVQNNWRTSSEMRLTGTRKELENAFLESIRRVKKNSEKLKLM